MVAETLQQIETKTKKSKILLVEDNLQFQIIYKVFLEEKFDLDFAESGEEGIELLKENDYSLLILDVNLAGKKNGIDVLKKIREDFAFRKIPVIVISAYNLAGDKERIISNGAQDCLIKPVDKRILIEKIYSYLASSKN